MHNFKDILFIGLLILHCTHAPEYNIALKKVVLTSTNLPDHLATMAIDQYLNTYLQVEYANDGKNVYPWVQFDLKGVYNITKIIIWPTHDIDYWMARIYAFVRLTNDTATNTDVYCSYEGPVQGVAFNCSKSDLVQGRYVLLKKESGFGFLTLKIAEVAILSEDIEFLVSITGPVEQSNVLAELPKYNALNAIDGNLTSCTYTAQEADVNRNITGWWKADLGDVYQVSSVNILELYAPAAYNRGYYSVYVDSGGFTKLQLCLFFNQSSSQFISFINLKCHSILTGRYLTVEKLSSAYRPDVIAFCEIQVVAIHNDLAYTLPINYIGVSTISTTKSPSTFTTTETCSNNCSSCEQKEKLKEMEKLMSSLQKKETEKIIIGIVVGLLTSIIFIILGFACGYMYNQKKNVKPMEPTIYEKTKEENADQHVYSDLNNTPMKEINTYYKETRE